MAAPPPVLFAETAFSAYGLEVPVGRSLLTAVALELPVELQLSDGRTVVVFATKTAALRCLAYLRATQQRLLLLSEVWVARVGDCKLLLGERTASLEPLTSDFVPVYLDGKVAFASWDSFALVPPEEALLPQASQVGAPLGDNAALRQAGLPLRVVDWNYFPEAPALQGSQLRDPRPLVYA